jgi:flavin reductase (DIM6/NTAB) family NADH-FMN oxidoreductase RutF
MTFPLPKVDFAIAAVDKQLKQQIDRTFITRSNHLSHVVLMARDKVDTFKFVHELNMLLKNGGVFLVAEGKDGKPNAMTIGWGFLGTMWSKPVFVTAVRHSRHTYKLMEETKSWTICIPAKGMETALDFCGTKSGRDHDKFKECKLTAKMGEVEAPYIEECPVHIECTTVFKTDMKPGQLEGGLEKEMYKTKDFHMLYFGEVKGVYAIKDAEKKLKVV